MNSISELHEMSYNRDMNYDANILSATRYKYTLIREYTIADLNPRRNIKHAIAPVSIACVYDTVMHMRDLYWFMPDTIQRLCENYRPKKV